MDAQPESPISPPQSSPQRRIIVWAVKVGLLVGIFVYLVYNKSFKPSEMKLLLSEWDWALFALLLTFPAAMSCVVRYRLLLKALGITCTFRELFQLSMIGAFFDLVSPMSNGGDLVKAYYLSRKYGRDKLGTLILSVIVDRVMGLFALFMFALLVCLAAWSRISADEHLRKMAYLLIALCAGSIVAFFILVSERLENSPLRKRLMHILPFHEKLESIYAGFAGLRHHHGTMLVILLLSMMNHTITCTGVLLLAQGLRFFGQDGAQAPLQIVPALIVLPLGFFLNSFGMGGGFGVGELAFEKLFLRVLGLSGGAQLALAFHIVGLVFRLLGFPFLLFYQHHSGVVKMDASMQNMD